MNSSKVVLVLTPEWGEKIKDYMFSWHCWLCDSEINRKSVKSLMSNEIDDSSSFNFFSCSSDSPIDNLDAALELVFDHHNELETEEAPCIIVVYGIPLDNKTKMKVAEFDLMVKESKEDWFSLVPKIL